MLALSVSKEKDEKRKRNTHKWINPTLLPLSLDMCRWSPVAVMHSDSRYHPLPKTTYHVTSGGGERQMNGPMALSVGRVKETNKQKTPKNSRRGSVRCCEEAEEEINTSFRLSFYEKVGETSFKSTWSLRFLHTYRVSWIDPCGRASWFHVFAKEML